jgi:predicted secreted protein
MQMHSYFRFIILLLVSTRITAVPVNNNTISLKVGDTKRIELPSKPSTGYSWYPTKEIKENPIISLVDSGYEAAQTGKAGSGGVQFWEIKGNKKGSTTLILEYKRSWEKNVKPNDKNVKPFIINVE